MVTFSWNQMITNHIWQYLINFFERVNKYCSCAVILCEIKLVFNNNHIWIAVSVQRINYWKTNLLLIRSKRNINFFQSLNEPWHLMLAKVIKYLIRACWINKALRMIYIIKLERTTLIYKFSTVCILRPNKMLLMDCNQMENPWDIGLSIIRTMSLSQTR